MGSNGERQRTLLSRLSITSCSATGLLRGRGPVPVRGLVVGDPCLRQSFLCVNFSAPLKRSSPWGWPHIQAAVCKVGGRKQSRTCPPGGLREVRASLGRVSRWLLVTGQEKAGGIWGHRQVSRHWDLGPKGGLGLG